MQKNDPYYCLHEAASDMESDGRNLCIPGSEHSGFHLLASGRCTHLCMGSWKMGLSVSFGLSAMEIPEMPM